MSLVQEGLIAKDIYEWLTSGSDNIVIPPEIRGYSQRDGNRIVFIGKDEDYDKAVKVIIKVAIEDL